MSYLKFKKQNWKNLLTIIRTYPGTFFKQLNFKNLNTFRNALFNEPPEQILRNIKKLLSNKTSDSAQTLKYNLSKFVAGLNALKTKKLVICISHEATRTGAPAIIRNIGKHFKENFEVECIYILCHGGEMVGAFERIAPSYELGFYDNDKLLPEEMDSLINTFKSDFDIQGIFFNSEASTKLLKFFKKEDIGPRISLIHETGTYFEKNAWKHISPSSDRIVFPCERVKELALMNSEFEEKKTQILPQGLMKPELLKINREDAHQELSKELGLSDDAFIVLACGSTDARKGIDIFTFTAIHTIRSTAENIHFVWIGDSKINEYKTWANRDVNQVQMENQIHFLGSKDDVSKYFGGSDVFFMSSRGDPFPCVVQEALASGLPVVGFEDTGGTPEMVPEGCGEILPYADIFNASKVILDYLEFKGEKLKGISKQCRDYAENSLDFQKYVIELNKLLKNEIPLR